MRSTLSVRKPIGYRPILTTGNPKTEKGEKLGYLTAILHLAPADLSGYQVCANAGNCKGPCLNLSGQGEFERNQLIRIAKTRFFFENQALFLECLRYDIRRLMRKARRMRFGRRRYKLAIRLNGTSDLPKLAMWMSAEFPDVQFYDYTKHPRPYQRMRENYHLTFSHDGPENVPACLDSLAHGVNVAVVFGVKDSEPLPATWNGYQVIDGTTHDLRFLDPTGVVVGLRPKGRRAKKAVGSSPFIVLANTPACAMIAAA